MGSLVWQKLFCLAVCFRYLWCACRENPESQNCKLSINLLHGHTLHEIFKYLFFITLSIIISKLRNNSRALVCCNHPGVFYKKGVLRNFAKFTGKHLCRSLFFNRVIEKREKILYWKRNSGGVFFMRVLRNF